MSLRTQLSNLSPREQKLLSAFGAVLAALIFIGGPAYVYSGLSDARSRNEEMRKLLAQMDRMGELLAKRKSERMALELRYASQAPSLASFIEEAASENGLEVPESTDRPDIKGKGYTERVTVVKMRKVGLKPLVKMLEKIERSKYPVSVSLLSIKARASTPDSYDVQLAVSAFDKESQAPAADKKTPAAKTPAKKDKGQEL